MRNRYCVLLLATIQLFSMEQGASHSKPVSRTVPSLQEIALKAYATHLHNRVPAESVTHDPMVEWCEWVGLHNFFDCALGASLTVTALKYALAQPNGGISSRVVSKYGFTSSLYSHVFSSDGRYQLFQDADKKQYVIHTNEQLCVERIMLMDQDVQFDLARPPLFSTDGRWLFGRHATSPKHQVLVRYALGMLDVYVVSLDLGEWEFEFLSTDTILLRTNQKIFVAQLDDLFVRGKESLQKIYERTDGTSFYIPWNKCKTVHVLAGPCIVCVGPTEKNFELFERGAEGAFSVTKTVPLMSPYAETKKIIVHGERGILARAINGYRDESIELYQLFGDDAGVKSKILAKKFVNCTFSPCGNYLAFQHEGGISIADCRVLTSPKFLPNKMSEPLGFGGARIVAWTNLGILGDLQRIIEFNRAAPLVARYAAHRNKQPKEKQ